MHCCPSLAVTSNRFSIKSKSSFCLLRGLRIIGSICPAIDKWGKIDLNFFFFVGWLFKNNGRIQITGNKIRVKNHCTNKYKWRYFLVTSRTGHSCSVWFFVHADGLAPGPFRRNRSCTLDVQVDRPRCWPQYRFAEYFSFVTVDFVSPQGYSETSKSTR